MTLASAINWFKGNNMEPQGPYGILGVNKGATVDEIKRAYRKLMMTHHPDLGGDIAITLSINTAYKQIRVARGF